MVLVPTSSTTKASRLAQQQPVRLQPSRHMPTSQQLRGTWRCRPMVRPEGSGAQRKAGIAHPCCAAFESGILRPELMPAEAPLVPQAAGERPSARSWAWSPAAVDMRFSWHWLKSHPCTCGRVLLPCCQTHGLCPGFTKLYTRCVICQTEAQAHHCKKRSTSCHRMHEVTLPSIMQCDGSL